MPHKNLKRQWIFYRKATEALAHERVGERPSSENSFETVSQGLDRDHAARHIFQDLDKGRRPIQHLTGTRGILLIGFAQVGPDVKGVVVLQMVQDYLLHTRQHDVSDVRALLLRCGFVISDWAALHARCRCHRRWRQ